MGRPEIPANSHIHMVGIGGVGVGPIAVVMAGMGYRISGSDLRISSETEKLRSLGITICAGHDAKNVNGADLVVASAAVPEDNPEVVAARAKGVPVWSRAKMLGWLMSGTRGVAVAGTHGKTTTTSMLAAALDAAGLDPTVYIGGNSGLLDGNGKLGHSGLFVAEACEAFNSFLELRPSIAAVTNIEADHLDCHGSLEGVIGSFRQFLSQIQDGGVAVMCLDCPNVCGVIPLVERRVVTYGLTDGADYHGHDVDVTGPESSFSISMSGRNLGRFHLRVPGLHNVRNAIAVVAVASELGAEPEAVREALGDFRGAGRRFEVLGTAREITIVDDYAHHPTEVAATLSAARSLGRRVVAVFQPHLYSRTQHMADGFAESLKQADLIYVTEIYPSREKPIPGVSATMITDLINKDGTGRAQFVPDKGRIPDEVTPALKPGDLVLVMGAGDIRSAGEALLSALADA